MTSINEMLQRRANASAPCMQNSKTKSKTNQKQMTETVLTLAEDFNFMPWTDLGTAEENCKGREWTSVCGVFTPEPLKTVTSLGFFLLLRLSKNSHSMYRTLPARVVTYTCKTKNPKFHLWPFWFNNIYCRSLLDHYVHCGLDAVSYTHLTLPTMAVV